MLSSVVFVNLVGIIFSLRSQVDQSLAMGRSLHTDMKDFEDWLNDTDVSLHNIQAEGLSRMERKEKLKELESQVTARHKYNSNHFHLFVWYVLLGRPLDLFMGSTF